MIASTTPQPLIREILDLHIDNNDIKLSVIRRNGSSDPILFLHGFGSTKEDFADIALRQDFANRPFLAYDTPGSGESDMSDLSKLSMPLLVSIAQAVLQHFKIVSYHLVGHSMGGLVSVLLAEKQTSSILSFINIKGNLAPEDCFLSRQIVDFAAPTPEGFVDEFISRTRQSPFYGNGLYAACFRAKVQAAAVHPTFTSMVHFTDHGELLEKFKGFPFPRMYMYGEQFRTLSYLEELVGAGVEVAEIPHAGHFVMYSNPVAMWERISQFLKRVEHFRKRRLLNDGQ